MKFKLYRDGEIVDKGNFDPADQATLLSEGTFRGAEVNYNQDGDLWVMHVLPKRSADGPGHMMEAMLDEPDDPVPKPPAIVESTLSQRGESYGDAWKLASQFLAELIDKYAIDTTVIIRSGYFYNWMSILSKLLRALVSPTKLDHWVDIAGYAQLVADDLDKE